MSAAETTGSAAVTVVDRQHVQVPWDLPVVSPGALTMWALTVWQAGEDETAYPTQETIQAALGRAGNDPSRLRDYGDELETAGMMEIIRTHAYRRTRNQYRPLLRCVPDDGRRYAALPPRLWVALRAGEIGPEHVVAAVRWLRYCDEQGGYTSSSVPEMAKRWGQSVSTVRRHRSALVKLGILASREAAGRPTLTAVPGRLPAPIQAPPKVIHRPEPADEPRSRIPGCPGHESRIAPVTDPGQNYPEDHYPKDNYLSSAPVGADGTDVDAREAGDDAAEPRANDEILPSERWTKSGTDAGKRRGRRPAPSRQAWSVLAELPSWLRQCEPWVRRRLAERIDRALTGTPYGPSSNGYGPAAIVGAAERYADSPDALVGASVPETDAQRHTRALSAALAMLAADVAAGACAECGHPHREADPGSCRCCDAYRPDQLAPAGPVAEPAPAGTAGRTGLAGELAAGLADDAAAGRCSCCQRTDPSARVRPELPLPMPVCAECWAPMAAELAAAGELAETA